MNKVDLCAEMLPPEMWGAVAAALPLGWDKSQWSGDKVGKALLSLPLLVVSCIKGASEALA